MFWDADGKRWGLGGLERFFFGRRLGIWGY